VTNSGVFLTLQRTPESSALSGEKAGRSVTPQYVVRSEREVDGVSFDSLESWKLVQSSNDRMRWREKEKRGVEPYLEKSSTASTERRMERRSR